MEKSRLCTNNSCMMSFLSINPNGDIFPCSRNYTNNFVIGNLKNISKFDDCFRSKSFLLLLNSAVKRRSKCLKSCELYSYCLGECNHNALICGKIEDMDFFIADALS